MRLCLCTDKKVQKCTLKIAASEEQKTNQKWPAGPINPKPNKLVAATLFQLISNFFSLSY